MDFKKTCKQFWDKYMRSPAERIDGRGFPEDERVRYRIVFSGLVQGVGFRYETWTIAQKLLLAGFVENLPNGDVYAEIEGPENKIMYLVECLKSIPRIQIDKVQMEEINIQNEMDFEIKN